MAFRVYRKCVLIAVVIGVIASLVGFHQTPKTYLATVPLMIAPEKAADNQGELDQILSMGAVRNVQTEASILKSENLFDLALQAVANKRSDPSLITPERAQELYKKYDVLLDARIVQVNVSADDPKLATDIADEVSNQYNLLRQRSSETSIADAQRYYDNQVALADKDLKAAEARVEAYKKQNGIVDLGIATSSAGAAQAALESQLTEAKSQAVVLASQIASQQLRLKSINPSYVASNTEVLTPEVQSLQANLSTYEAQRADLLRVYTPESIKVQNIDTLIRDIRQKLTANKNRFQKSTIQTAADPLFQQLRQEMTANEVQRESIGKRIDVLTSALVEERAKLSKIPGQESKLAQLLREQQIYQAKFGGLRTQLEQLRMKEANGMRQASVLFPARANPDPVAPLLPKYLVAGVAGGLCVGMLFGFFLTSTRPYLDSTQQLESVLGLPVVATIPALTGPRRNNLAVLSDPHFTPSEGARLAATSLFSPRDGYPKVVVLASTERSPRWTELAAEVALVCARLGLRTTLLDGDLRDGVLTRRAGRDSVIGLRDVLNVSALPSASPDAESGIHLLAQASSPLALPSDAPTSPGGHPLLQVIGIGQNGPDSFGDVPNRRMDELFAALRGSNDVIIVMAPPVTATSDAYRLAQFADEVCLLVSGKGSDMRRVAMVRDILARTYGGAVSAIWGMNETLEEEFPLKRRRSTNGQAPKAKAPEKAKPKERKSKPKAAVGTQDEE